MPLKVLLKVEEEVVGEWVEEVKKWLLLVGQPQPEENVMVSEEVVGERVEEVKNQLLLVGQPEENVTVSEEVVGEWVEEVMEEEEELLLWVVEVMAGMVVVVMVEMVGERACFEAAVLVWY